MGKPPPQKSFFNTFIRLLVLVFQGVVLVVLEMGRVVLGMVFAVLAVLLGVLGTFWWT